MSLDVYLYTETDHKCNCSYCGFEKGGLLYTANITHNLNDMAEALGVYEHLWRPDEIGITHAAQLFTPLTEAHTELSENPEKYKKYNPSNGWGDLYDLRGFIRRYAIACHKYPCANVKVDR